MKVSEKSSNTVITRAALLQDLVTVENLYEKLFESQATLMPSRYTDGKQSKTFILKTISSQTSDIILIEKEKIAMGFVLVQEQKTLDYACLIPYKFLHVMDVYIDTPYRKQGYGKQLLAAALAWGKEKDLVFAELRVLECNEAAKAFYKKKGFKTDMLTMSKEL